MGRLTTHVLDTARGVPGAGMAVELYALDDASGRGRRLVIRIETNSDGRCDSPLLEGKNLEPGTYELVFHAGDYFRATEIDLPDPPFVDRAVVRFGIADADAHYHVPLLVSPWSYSTYRGS